MGTYNCLAAARETSRRERPRARRAHGRSLGFALGDIPGTQLLLIGICDRRGAADAPEKKRGPSVDFETLGSPPIRMSEEELGRGRLRLGKSSRKKMTGEGKGGGCMPLEDGTKSVEP